MSIQKRTVLYEKTKSGVYRFSDWALSTTPLGVCAEPFSVNLKKSPGGINNFDATDEMSRVDEMQNIDLDREKFILSGGEHALHGGALMPRTGR